MYDNLEGGNKMWTTRSEFGHWGVEGNNGLKEVHVFDDMNNETFQTYVKNWIDYCKVKGVKPYYTCYAYQANEEGDLSP